MGIKGILLLALSFAANAENLPVEDEDFGCIEARQAQGYVEDFQINVSSFGGMELCNSAVDTKKLFNDLQLVEQGHFSGDKKNLFIREAIPSSQYFSWLKEMTASIRRGHDMPTATAYNSWGNFTMQDGWAILSTLGRVGVLIHEARHTEGYYHTQCVQGPYKDANLSGCDTTIADEGAHGVEMEYYSRVVLQGDNFHPVYRQMARLMNLARANFVFNEAPMTQNEALIATANEDLVWLDEDTNLNVQHVDGLADYQLHRSSLGVTLHRPGEALAIDLYSRQQVPVKDEFSYFKLLIDQRLTNVVDLQEFDVANRRYLVALTEEGRLYTYVFSSGAWSQGTLATDVVRLVTTAPTGAEGLFVVTRQNRMAPLNPSSLQRGQALPVSWPEGVQSVVKWNDLVLAVTAAHEVQDLNSGKTFQPLAEYPVQQLARVPLYNAFARTEGK